MVAGGTNLGKSTFLNCLFEQDIVPDNQGSNQSLNLYSLNYDSEGIKKKISVIDTPSFGTTSNDEKKHSNIVNYLKQQFDIFLAEESKIRRNPRFEDTRVHCLIYFVSPSVHGMKKNDIDFLKKVAKLVNIIPVVGKSDGLTAEELNSLRRKVKQQFKENEIEIYDFEKDLFDRNLEMNANINENVPFSIINYENYNTHSEKVRTLPWGVINIEDKMNCDYVLVKEILLSNYIDNLMEKTANKLYEEYRSEILSDIMPTEKN